MEAYCADGGKVGQAALGFTVTGQRGGLKDGVSGVFRTFERAANDAK